MATEIVEEKKQSQTNQFSVKKKMFFLHTLLKRRRCRSIRFSTCGFGFQLLSCHNFAFLRAHRRKGSCRCLVITYSPCPRHVIFNFPVNACSKRLRNLHDNTKNKTCKVFRSWFQSCFCMVFSCFHKSVTNTISLGRVYANRTSPRLITNNRARRFRKSRAGAKSRDVTSR